MLLLNSNDNQLLEFVLDECLKQAEEKKQLVVFIQDQTNLMKKVFPPIFIPLLMRLNFICFVTTSTDVKLNDIKRKDATFGAKEYSLNPLTQMTLEEKKIVLKSTFNLKEDNDKNLMEFLLNETDANFTLLQEFHK